jgi:hypothetical protein
MQPLLTALVGLAMAAQPPAARPYKVTIVAEKNEAAEQLLPADPKIRVEYRYNGNLRFGVLAEGKRLTSNSNSVQTLFLIDGKVQAPKDGKKLQALADRPGQKKRNGGQTVWRHDDIRVTLTLEVVPGKPSRPRPGAPIPRLMDTLLVRYSIENLGTEPHTVGCRTFVNTLVVENDGALFASPTTHPNQVLNGVVLKDKEMPDFLEVLQRPNLKDPGFKGVFTFKLGGNLEKPGKVVLTTYGARGPRDVPAQRAGDSACAFYWEPQELPPQAHRELAFAYGHGIASTNAGRVSADFGGSFAPGKTFTVTAYVDDPMDGQSLTLLLPEGVERQGGKATQVVPLAGDDGRGVVLWRCRLAQVGTYPIRIRSSDGVTQSWTVKVTPPD